MDRDDDALTAAYYGGDTAAFGVLYERYVERIYRFVYYKTLNREVAEDIVGSVFLKALEKMASFDRNKGAFSQWLYGIARHAVIDYYRARVPSVPIEDVFDALAHDERIEQQSDARASLKEIRAYMKQLTPRQREIITLRVWEGKTYAEIADIVGGSEESVKMMFSRAIREIRSRFGNAAYMAFLLQNPLVELLH